MYLPLSGTLEKILSMRHFLKTLLSFVAILYMLNHPVSPVIPTYHTYDEGIKYLNKYNPIPDPPKPASQPEAPKQLETTEQPVTPKQSVAQQETKPVTETAVQPASSPLVIKDDTTNAQAYNSAIAVVNSLPGNIQTLLEDNGWAILVTNSGIQSNWCAETKYTEKRIYIRNRAANKSTIYHEVGHAVDAINDFEDTFSTDLEQTRQEELGNFKSTFATNNANADNASEYFAEATYRYLTSPEQLNEACPRTFEYVSGKIG